MKWEKVKLGEVLDNIVGGGTPSKLNLNYWSGNIYWCSVKDMSFDTHYLSSTKDTITEEGLKNSTSNLIKQGTVITATRMGLGRAFINKVDMAINQDLKALIPNKKIDNLFLLWTIIYKREEILSMGRGATVNGITLDMLTDIQITLPPLDIQRKIANTMSMYDDLIENNQKQIKLLEEAAQRLYKEWFVDFRFPGYGDTKFIDGIPDGWRKQKISNFGEIKTGKTPSTTKESYYGGHIPFVKIPDMHNRIYPIVTETTLTSEGANTQKNQFIPKNSIMVSCIGTVGLVNISIELCQTNQQINSIMPNDEKDLYYIYSTMKRLKTLLEGVGSNGATMTNVNKTKFGNLEVLYPNYDLRDKYFNNCKVIFEKIFSLSVGIEKLTQARDRLLPKLMSGEIEV